MFSIVIPLYNKEKYISRTLQSVLNQTFQDFEIVIVDDGSTDNSVTEVETFSDSRIHIVRQKNGGISAARNRGIKESKYDLIAFLDADDEWYENYLEVIVALIIKYPNAGLYATSFSTIDKNAKENTIPIDKELIPGDSIIDYFKMSFLCKHLFITSSVCIRKNVFSDVGLFSKDKEVEGEDLEMWQRVALHYDIAFSPLACLKYYTDIENSASKYKVYKREKHVEMLNELIDSKKIPENKIFYVREFAAKGDLRVAKDMILTGENIKARKLLLDCNTKLLKKSKYILLVLTFVPSRIILAARNILKNG